MTTEIIPQLALLKISGADAGDFLQGQLTNDVNEPGITASEKWQISGYCNPQGRLLALFYLWKQGGDFYALLNKDLLEQVSNRLKMFVMRSKVSIEIVEHAIVSGAFSKQAVGNSNHTELLADDLRHTQLISDEQSAILAINKRFLLVNFTAADGSYDDTELSSSNWLSFDIEDGFPQISASSVGLFIPQMLNLDLLDGINFKKGCYTGQEIVARLHYLGNLKQRMFVCTAQATAGKTFQAGHRIFADSELTKAVGTLVSVSNSGENLLAVLRLDRVEGRLFLNQQTSLVVDKSQPYQV